MRWFINKGARRKNMQSRSLWRKVLGIILATIMAAGMQLPELVFADQEMELRADPGPDIQGEEWTKGSGTEDDPYLIETEANLVYLRDSVNNGNAANSTNLGEYSGTYFKQTADLDLNDMVWTPIGVYASSNAARAFSGHYDGGGHAISGLNVNMAAVSANQGAGLFGYVKGNAENRVSIEGVVVDGSVVQTAASYGYTAALVAYGEYIDIRNCGNEAEVQSAYQTAAGIIANPRFYTIDGCYNHGDITSTYARGGYAGGISAMAANSSYANAVTNCYNTGSITSSYYAGGINSQLYGMSTSAAHTFRNCYNAGTITATDTDTHAGEAGGIIGYMSSGGAQYASTQVLDNCHVLAGSAAKTYIGSGSEANMTITNCSSMSDEDMQSAEFVLTLGDMFIGGTTYPVLYWEAPDGIPVITVQPQDTVYEIGDEAEALSVEAEGDPENGELVYQWYMATKKDLSDAAAIDQADSDSYVPATDTIGDFYYYCGVNNDVQTLDESGPFIVKSNPAHIQVWSGITAVAPTITKQPADIEAVGQGGMSGNELSVEAAFAGEDETDNNCRLSYQWQTADTADGEFSDIDGATEAVYAASTKDLGTKYYRCVVTNTRERQSSASTTSEVVSVTVEGYKIDSYDKLKEFAAMVDAGDDFAGRSVTLDADITIESDYNPAGDYSTNTYTNPAHFFKGEFDGAGHTITFNDIETDKQYYAIVAAADDGASFHDLIIKGSISSASTNVAGVVAYAGKAAGEISFERIGNEADISSTGVTNGSSPSNAAGILGGSYTTMWVYFTDCYNKGDITGSGSRVAGIAAYSKSRMTSCYNTGEITSTGTYSSATYPDSIGGLHGGLSGDTIISNSYNTGIVAVPNAKSGHNKSGSISGQTSVANPEGDNVSYWLEGTSERARGGTGTQPSGYISKTAEEFADESGDSGMLKLLANTTYAEKWQAGSALAAGVQASPALHWEKTAETPKHTVTFDPNGGTLAEGCEAEVEVEEGKTVEKPADPTNGTTKLFDGWYNGEEEYDFEEPVTEDITLTAKWSTKRVVSVTVQNAPADVKMVYEDVTAGEEKEFTEKMTSGKNIMFLSTKNPGDYYGTHDVKITVSAEGYEDWVIESPGKDGTNNISKSGKLTPIEYTVTYELDGGTNAESNPASYTIESDDITLADPSKDDCEFEGWFDNAEFEGEAVTGITKGSTGDKTFYAKWKEIPRYKITFVDEDGETILKESVEYLEGTKAEDIEKPDDPTKPETAEYTYTFEKWVNAESGEEIADVTEDATYKAVYTATKKTVMLPIYRLYNKKSGEHLWTASKNEYNVLAKQYGWTQEGVAWYAPDSGKGVLRLYNPTTGDHHYTSDSNEAKVLTTKYGWKYDNNAKPLFYSGGKTPIYRLYNKNLKRGSHHLTKSRNEYDTLKNYGWKQEGVAMYCEK